jgi:pimeloyl-ACP methyl ester carboxylesterase
MLEEQNMVTAKVSSYHPFRSAKARDKYLRFYDARAAKWWPVASETKMVATSEGETFVRISGPVEAPPLVLLPGMRTTSHMWSLMIETLSGSFRTYAVDAIFDIGRSISVRSITSKKDIMSWLDGLLDGLGLQSGVNMMGQSMGSHVTAEYSMHAPERLAKVVLLSMAGGVSRPNYLVAIPLMTALIPLKSTMIASMGWMLPDAKSSTGKAREIFIDSIEEMLLWLKCFRFQVMPTKMVRVLKDSELRGIKVPVLYIGGENERICSTAQAVKRLQTVAPNIETFVVPNAAHGACWVQPDMIGKRVIEFLTN